MLALKTLSLKAKAAIGLCFFCGLRPGEARGAEWQDYDGTNCGSGSRFGDAAHHHPEDGGKREVLASNRTAC